MSFSYRSQCFFASFMLFFLNTAITEATYASVKSLGMAGAVTAHPVDTLVAAYNPGGLGFVGNRWDLGCHYVHQYGKTKFRDNFFVNDTFDSHSTFESANLFIPEFGINKYTCECAFTWGFVIYNRSFFKTDYAEPIPIFGTSRPGLEYLHYVAAPTCTVIIACDHCIGATLDFHGQRLKVNGLENFDNKLFSSSPGRVTNKGYEYSGGIGGTIGWMSRVSNCVSIGAAWSPMVKMSRFRDYEGLVARRGRVNIPQRFVGGIAIEMCPGFTATFDIEHVKYNEISPLNHELDLLRRRRRRRDDDHKKGNRCKDDKDKDKDKRRDRKKDRDEHKLGEDQGSGLGWRDQTIFRFGADWRVDEESSYRFGYWYHRDPIKSSQTFANALLPYVLERGITFGGSWMCSPCDEFSFYVAYTFRSVDNGKKSIPKFLGGGEVNLNESRWRAGFSWAKYF